MNDRQRRQAKVRPRRLTPGRVRTRKTLEGECVDDSRVDVVEVRISGDTGEALAPIRPLQVGAVLSDKKDVLLPYSIGCEHTSVLEGNAPPTVPRVAVRVTFALGGGSSGSELPAGRRHTATGDTRDSSWNAGLLVGYEGLGAETLGVSDGSAESRKQLTRRRLEQRCRSKPKHGKWCRKHMSC